MSSSLPERAPIQPTGLRRLLGAVGIDRAIFYTILGRGWGVLAGPITLFFVARYLSGEEQGFYYTFSSVLALQVFFELGLGHVILQFASHEMAHLRWTTEGTVEGDSAAKIRLASLLQLTFKWYLVAAVAACVVLAISGLLFFGQYEASGPPVTWRLPWILIVVTACAGLLPTPFYGILEGCGRVADIRRMNVRQVVVASVFCWAAFALHWKLYASGVFIIAAQFVSIGWMTMKHRQFFRDLLTVRVPTGAGLRWRQDILPFQWKITLSWLSGYFIFQLANPVLFRFHGAVEAGRMGMTMKIIESITAVAIAWVSTKAAPFGVYVARRDFALLDRVFWKASVQSVGVVILGGLSFLALYYALRSGGVAFVDRLLAPLPTVLLLGGAVVNCVIFNQALYLRSHKQEPFLFNSILGAVMVPAVMYFLGRPFGALGIAAGLLGAGLLVSLPLATLVFYRKRREWHLPA